MHLNALASYLYKFLCVEREDFLFPWELGRNDV